MFKIIFRPQSIKNSPSPPVPPLPPQTAALSKFPFLRNYSVAVTLDNIRPPENYVQADFQIKDTTSRLDVTVQNLTVENLAGSSEFFFRANDASNNDTRVYLIYTFADASTKTDELQLL